MPFKKIPEQVPEGHKRCFLCSSARPLHLFHRERRNADGRTSACIRCRRRRTRERNQIEALVAESAERMAVLAYRTVPDPLDLEG